MSAAYSYDNLVEFKGRSMVAEKSENYDPKKNYVQTPHAFYDKLLSDIDTLAELKVTEIIIRKTYGYLDKTTGKDKRDGDLISHSQFMELCNLSKPSVIAGLEAGIKRGSICRKSAGNQGFIYSINFEYVSTPKIEARGQHKNSKAQLVKSLYPLETGKESLPERGKEFRPEGVKSFDTQKKEERNIKEIHATKDKLLSEAPKKGKKPPKPKDTRLSHPAVVKYRDLAKLTPNEVQRDLIVTNVVDFIRWEQTLTEWLGKGYSKANIKDMVKVYLYGWDKPGQRQSSQPPPKTNGVPKTRPALDAYKVNGVLTPEADAAWQRDLHLYEAWLNNRTS